MVASASPIPLGSIIDGKFRVTKEIGRGGMAAVFEAENIDIGKRVAVKVLSQELAQSKVVNERFIREARAAAKIRSPYICDVFDVGTYNSLPFLVLELLEGESLYDKLARERKLSVEDTLRIAEHASRGLQKAHDEGIVHRDLKPENIFLTREDDGESVTKIVDFGLAKFYEPHLEGGPQARLTKDGALFGTPAYMSPEQARALGDVDHRCDLWALACIVYEMLTGRTVWNVDQGVAMILAQIAGAPLPRPSKLREDLPKTFDRWFERALDRNIEKRFQSAKEFFDALKLALSPVTGSIKVAPHITEADGFDDLATNPVLPAVPPLPSPGSLGNRAGAEPMAISSSAPTSKRGKGRLTLGLISAMALLGGGVAWYFGHLSAIPALIGLDREELPPPIESEPYAIKLAAAQQALFEGGGAAKAEFEQAFSQGKEKAARSLWNHVSVAYAEDGLGPCTLRAIGHPRPFDATTNASRPALALTSRGLVVSWADSHEDKKKRQIYTTLLDPALRRVYPVRSATPEARSVRDPRLLLAGKQLALMYWDYAGDQPGVYLRPLELDGRIAGAPALLSKSDVSSQFSPTIAREADGALWLIWAEQTEPGVQDLFALHLAEDFKPLGEKVRLTAHGRPSTGQAVLASVPALAIAEQAVAVVFMLERGTEHSLELLRLDAKAINASAAGNALGAAEPRVTLTAAGAGGSAAGAESARYLGNHVTVAAAVNQYTTPQIACIPGGCFLSWDAEKGGAVVGFIEDNAAELMWHRELGEKSIRPGVGSNGSNAALAYYDDGRLKFAKLGRDGVAEASIVGRVNGFQPSPELVSASLDTDDGATKGLNWLVAFRDFEAAEHEPFVLRTECQ